jgi:eukaryotic-like serine/threonine-protein kinase
MIEPTQTYNPELPSNTASQQGDSPLHTAPLTAPTGYELESLIGEGGMGVVYRARDVALSRDVAVKFLQGRFAPASAIGLRFTEEARITSQLQHPGIPPVHQVGTLPDGRPFLAMKLIKGDTLDELLKRRNDPGVDRGRYLAVFEQMAQAVGYAHAHNVIHRDLKPANIMVGSFGEVQVMDWGLAKVLAAGQQPETLVEETKLGTEIRSLRDEATQAGSLLGTPAFMPPEQAIGAVDQITTRSDVFGLGAILCVILTGQPPFLSESAESSRQKAARAKLDEAFARLDGCGAEPELIALTKRCLAPEPQDRPRDAGEVAEAITALRANAERRARQAEMERARAEVRAAEERKRRRVKLALVLTLFTLIAVAGFAAWGIESVTAERNAERLTREAEQKSRENELLSRQLATERDVIAALNEAQVLREEGWKQADDTARWALTLTAARSSFKRAQSLLNSGDPTEELRARVSAIGTGLDQDERDRSLLAELDRIEEESDLRFMVPAILSGRYAERYSYAFRGYGIDLLAMPTSDAVTWLKRHRFRERLTTAVCNWEHVRPITDMQGLGDVTLIEPAQISAAVAGEAAVQALMSRPSIRDRLKAIVNEVNDDPFAREWRDALASGNPVTFKKLFARPEFNRLSSRELSSLVDDLSNSILLIDHREILSELLSISYDRFPGDYWVNFRLGSSFIVQSSKELEAQQRFNSIRYLTAAVAARPRSAMPRVALGVTLLDKRKDDPSGLRMLGGAATLDPTSPWPHLMLGYSALQVRNWSDMFAALREAARIDPETSYFMISSLFQFGVVPEASLAMRKMPEGELGRFYDDLIALYPEHAGGYILRASFRQKNGEYRAALEDYRKALPLTSADNPLRALAKSNLNNLETIARWEGKLPAVIKGEFRPSNAFESLELAEYCAGFEQKYVLAVKFASDAFAGDPNLYAQFMKVPQVAGWAIKAATGKGVDAAKLSEPERSQLRKNALAWLQKTKSKVGKDVLLFLSDSVLNEADLDPVREPEAIAQLPPDEGAEWTRFWAELPKREKK